MTEEGGTCFLRLQNKIFPYQSASVYNPGCQEGVEDAGMLPAGVGHFGNTFKAKEGFENYQNDVE